jgi:Transposase domain (DUF772)/Transposase DDE domain
VATIPQPFLFSWQHVDAASDLDRLGLVLSAMPDEKLVVALEAARGRGRDDYPVRPVWNSILAGVVFQHPSVASLRRELRRNAELRAACGFDPALGEKAVPTDSAYSNFVENLVEREPDVRSMFHALGESLRAEIPDLGRFLVFDGKALPSFAKGPKKQTSKEGEQAKESEEALAAQDEPPDRRRDDDADWGVKTYRGKRADGTPWEKVVTWFGFELHLLADSAHEMPLNYKVTKASASEQPELLSLVGETKQLHPAVIETAEQLAADKGLDSEDNNKKLFDDYGIRPIIDKRSDWRKGQDETRALFPDRVDTVVYDVQGTISCICPQTSEQRPMTFWGFESDRGTLKYRCPAAANGFECKGRAGCPSAQTDYGKIVRIPIENDRRMFTPIPRDSDAWKKGYDRRTAVERINSRIDRVLGFELHTIRGIKKMEVRVGIALVVLLAMALGRIRAGQREQMRSLLAPVKRAAAP